MTGHPKIDRRAARTRARLHHALMSLILDKRYEEVTVADICAAAKVGRSTFYAHFPSKDGLRRHGLDQLRKRIVEQHGAALAGKADPGDEPLAFSRLLFEHARDHLDRGAALAAIRQTFADLVRDELAPGAKEQSEERIPRELAVQYVTGAFMAVLAWWLDRAAELPAERIDSMFRRLATNGVMRGHVRSGGGFQPPRAADSDQEREPRSV